MKEDDEGREGRLGVLAWLRQDHGARQFEVIPVDAPDFLHLVICQP
jgi:hypothetical protein